MKKLFLFFIITLTVVTAKAQYHCGHCQGSVSVDR